MSKSWQNSAALLAEIFRLERENTFLRHERDVAYEMGGKAMREIIAREPKPITKQPDIPHNWRSIAIVCDDGNVCTIGMTAEDSRILFEFLGRAHG